tara:strand:+ start:236 stop:529 length:294 start_codon:yes stop_codon:yes gene_type:complete
MKIPTELKEQIITKVQVLNKKLNLDYKVRISGKYFYLDNNGEKTARLKYTGGMLNWDFAIFKWSSETYDSEEMFFPGAEELDGTIEGAMKAGDLAYR